MFSIIRVSGMVPRCCLKGFQGLLLLLALLLASFPSLHPSIVGCLVDEHIFFGKRSMRRAVDRLEER